jgi:hypothetical protein
MTQNLDTLAISDIERMLTAQVRQVFRAVHAADDEASAQGVIELNGSVVHLLARQLAQDPRWGKNDSFLDYLCGTPIAITPPTWLRVSDRVAISPGGCQSSYSCQEYEPFEFEMELCPDSGALLGYSMQFGDRDRFLEGSNSDNRQNQNGNWAFTFLRGNFASLREAHRAPADQMWFLHENGKALKTYLVPVGHEPNERDVGEREHSREATIEYFCNLIAVCARQLSRAYGAKDRDSIALSNHRLTHFVDSAIKFQMRVDGVQDWPWP